jgi:hypothetical protein
MQADQARFELAGVGDLHPAVARSPLVEGGIADAVLAAQLARRQPAACSFSTLMICSSVNLLLRMSVSLGNGLYPKTGH